MIESLSEDYIEESLYWSDIIDELEESGFRNLDKMSNLDLELHAEILRSISGVRPRWPSRKRCTNI